MAPPSRLGVFTAEIVEPIPVKPRRRRPRYRGPRLLAAIAQGSPPRGNRTRRYVPRHGSSEVAGSGQRCTPTRAESPSAPGRYARRHDDGPNMRPDAEPPLDGAQWRCHLDTMTAAVRSSPSGFLIRTMDTRYPYRCSASRCSCRRCRRAARETTARPPRLRASTLPVRSVAMCPFTSADTPLRPRRPMAPPNGCTPPRSAARGGSRPRCRLPRSRNPRLRLVSIALRSPLPRDGALPIQPPPRPPAPTPPRSSDA